MQVNSKEKARQRAKEWYKNNKEKVLLKMKVRASSPIQKDKKRKYDQEYRILNQDKINTRLHDWYLNNKKKTKNKARIWKQKNPEKAQFLRYQDRAKEYGSILPLSYEEFFDFIHMPCVYCGFNSGVVGIDRIDSTIGYDIDNIIPCCKVCNYMKLDHSIESWLTSMEDIFINLGFKIIK